MAGSAVAESPGEPRECWANGELEDVAEQQETAICQKSSTPGSRQVAVAKVWRAEKASWEYQSAVDGKGAVPRLLVRVLGFPWRIRQKGLCTAMCGPWCELCPRILGDLTKMVKQGKTHCGHVGNQAGAHLFSKRAGQLWDLCIGISFREALPPRKAS